MIARRNRVQLNYKIYYKDAARVQMLQTDYCCFFKGKEQSSSQYNYRPILIYIANKVMEYRYSPCSNLTNIIQTAAPVSEPKGLIQSTICQN
jgi:uncharacterized protein YbcV (DUF1398 family)